MLLCECPVKTEKTKVEVRVKRTKSFIKTTLLGGLVVILPATIIVAVFSWLYAKATSLIQPVTDFLVEKSDLKEVMRG